MCLHQLCCWFSPCSDHHECKGRTQAENSATTTWESRECLEYVLTSNGRVIVMLILVSVWEDNKMAQMVQNDAIKPPKNLLLFESPWARSLQEELFYEQTLRKVGQVKTSIWNLVLSYIYFLLVYWGWPQTKSFIQHAYFCHPTRRIRSDRKCTVDAAQGISLKRNASLHILDLFRQTYRYCSTDILVLRWRELRQQSRHTASWGW